MFRLQPIIYVVPIFAAALLNYSQGHAGLKKTHAHAKTQWVLANGFR